MDQDRVGMTAEEMAELERLRALQAEQDRRERAAKPAPPPPQQQVQPGAQEMSLEELGTACERQALVAEHNVMAAVNELALRAGRAPTSDVPVLVDAVVRLSELLDDSALAEDAGSALREAVQALGRRVGFQGNLGQGVDTEEVGG